MKQYELMFIVVDGLPEDQIVSNIEKVQSIISNGKGVITNVNKWGTKKFEYPINFKTHGYYVVVNFESEPELIPELNRQLLLNESIVRHVCIKR